MGTVLLLLQAVIVEHKAPPPPLDPYVRAALPYFETPMVGAWILLLVLFLTVCGRCWAKRWADGKGILRAAFAVFIIVTGATVGLIFLFTDPPAVGNLSLEARWVIGIVTFVSTGQFLIQELHMVFFRKHVNVSPSPTPPIQAATPPPKQSPSVQQPQRRPRGKR
jgi:hypothetical protein